LEIKTWKLNGNGKFPAFRLRPRITGHTTRQHLRSGTTPADTIVFGDPLRLIIMTKTIFITGASSGVGEATARLFAAKGWNVVATSRSLGKFESAEKMLPLSLDVTDKAAIADAVEKTRRRFGGLDVLVNNAGIGLGGPLEAVTDQQLRAIFDTNFFCCRDDDSSRRAADETSEVGNDHQCDVDYGAVGPPLFVAL
jgi:NAD(P)-dependent dehydrogenase (short-subunit alcohol dehydrogenase family)